MIDEQCVGVGVAELINVRGDKGLSGEVAHEGKCDDVAGGGLAGLVDVAREGHRGGCVNGCQSTEGSLHHRGRGVVGDACRGLAFVCQSESATSADAQSLLS